MDLVAFVGCAAAGAVYSLLREGMILEAEDERRVAARDSSKTAPEVIWKHEELPSGCEVLPVARMERVYGEKEFVESPLVGRSWPENDRFVNVDEKIVVGVTVRSHPKSSTRVPRAFVHAGPTEALYWDASSMRVAIVTCGGLCPGLNTVIREIVMALHYSYNVRDILGIRNGYKGFYDVSLPPMQLTPSKVAHAHTLGGTILGTSRGGFDAGRIVEGIVSLGVHAVFVIGGDGTHRGALALSEELAARNVVCSVAGVPKTIDCDIPLVDKTFGFETAVARANECIHAAHTEALSTPNGVGLVKLMGRSSGFIATHAALASHEANLCLIPEVPYKLSQVCEWLRDRLVHRGHAVIVIAEGAIAVPEDFDPAHDDPEDSIQKALENRPKDASGNVKLPDVGETLMAAINEHFASPELKAVLPDAPSVKYIDPSYMIRSVPSDSSDSSFCAKLAFNAVHGVMAGFTMFSSGTVDGHGVLIPIKDIAGRKMRKVDPTGRTWGLLLRSTGQPRLDGSRNPDGSFIVPTKA